MADVYDRWHKSRPKPGEPRCREHDKVPTADHGDGRRWQVRYRDAGGVQRKENYDRKPAADARAKLVGADLLKGTHIDLKAGRVLVGKYAAETWLPQQVHLRPNSAQTYGYHLRTHILPVFGERQAAAVKRSDAKSWVASLTTKLAPATVGTVVAVVRSMWNAMIEDSMVPGNPFARLDLPEVEPAVLEPLPIDAVRALAASITPRYEVCVWLGAGVGAREGEAFGLLASRVEFLKRRIQFVEQGQGGRLAPLKTKASKAPVPVDGFVLDRIAEHLRRWPVNGTGLVVTNRSGKMLRRGGFGWCWRNAVEAAGLPEGTRFHDLRHFYASTLIAAGLYPKVVQARLRHATLAETMDVYGHLFPDHEELGRGALDRAFAGDVPQECPQTGS